ncbi:MAG: aspartate dehydrogenase domain-containing protein [Candidatus Latescibacterota bacterium]|nr:aspartate dehydrogenase domain-containing protein [Candidatus Latescibacterota bacterium]
MAQTITRVGLIGYGQIGSAVRDMIDKDDNGIEVVFIHDQDTSRLRDLGDLGLEDLSKFDERSADLVVEMAHPMVTREWGTRILEKTNYMFISVTALADRELEESIEATSRKFGTRAYVPHGGVVGMDALLENRDIWESVDVVMKKAPKNVDCAAIGLDPETITEETVLYDGPTRDICPKFPRNVNTHAAIAYAGIGFDRTRSLLVVNPEWTDAIVEIHAKGPGIVLDVARIETITGVTGASTPASIYNTVQMIGSTGSGIHLR